MPVTFGAFTLGALGLAGMPLLVGFVSKWNLGLGALQSGQALFLGILVLSGIFNLAYFFPIVSAAFFGQGDPTRHIREAKAALWVPLALTAFLSLLLGVMPNAGLALYHLAWQAAEGLTASPPAGPIGGTP